MPGIGSVACPKPTPWAIARKQRKSAKQARLDAAYEAVDQRDGGICRATGAYTVPGAVSPEQRREHHHLAGRNVRPDWKYAPERIITVRADVHQLITNKVLLVEGTDARKRIVFHWNRDVIAPGKEPFKLRSKRRSQHREAVA